MLMLGLPFKHGRVAALTALVVLAALFGAVAPGVALLLAPAAMLLTALLLGFTPGERLIERMRTRRFEPRVHRAPRRVVTRHVDVVVRRVTSLDGSALAMRPPPVALALSS